MPIQYWYDAGDTLKFQFDNQYYVPPEPGYKYLAFYGRSGTSNGWFYELELSTTSGFIDYNNPVPLITVVGTVLDSDPRWNNPSCIFDGQYTQAATETLIFDPNVIGVLFYMENSSRIEVQSGSYYTYDSEGSSAILSGAIYGTNTDPTTFDATDELNWDFVCDLTVISETPEAPPDPVMRLEPTGGSWQGSYDYYYFGTTSDARYLYGLVQKGETVRAFGDDQWDFKYGPNDGKWYDVGTGNPFKWGIDANATNLSYFPTQSNMQTHYLYEDNNDNVLFVFDNPYYVAPVPMNFTNSQLGLMNANYPNSVNTAESNGWKYYIVGDSSNQYSILNFDNSLSSSFYYVAGAPQAVLHYQLPNNLNTISIKGESFPDWEMTGRAYVISRVNKPSLSNHTTQSLLKTITLTNWNTAIGDSIVETTGTFTDTITTKTLNIPVGYENTELDLYIVENIVGGGLHVHNVDYFVNDD